MRFSHQREIIYKSICSVDTHPTATEIFNMVKSKIENISLGTIYRNLEQLFKKNMIRELNLDGISHYDGNMKSHQHFICKKCKAIIDCHTQNDWNVDNIKETKEVAAQLALALTNMLSPKTIIKIGKEKIRRNLVLKSLISFLEKLLIKKRKINGPTIIIWLPTNFKLSKR